MGIRPEVIPFLGVTVLVGLLVGLLLGYGSPLPAKGAAGIAILFVAVMGGYFLWFFRDPERTAPTDADLIVAAADGEVAKIAVFKPEEFGKISMLAGLNAADLEAFAGRDVLRVSIFLSLFNVHVNRAPIAGRSRFLGYFPGKHLFTFDEKSSDVNQHNSILIYNERTTCLVNQIVGPVCRRVVYWLNHEHPVDIELGGDFGMMKFGSRLDMYFPAEDIELLAAVGDRVTAGESVIGKYSQK